MRKPSQAYRQPLRDYLVESVVAAKQQSITWLVAELMDLLVEHGYTFEQLLEGLSDYVDEHPQLEPLLGYLEEASSVAHGIFKKSEPTEETTRQ
jgi:hypothetical protein